MTVHVFMVFSDLHAHVHARKHAHALVHDGSCLHNMSIHGFMMVHVFMETCPWTLVHDGSCFVHGNMSMHEFMCSFFIIS